MFVIFMKKMKKVKNEFCTIVKWSNTLLYYNLKKKRINPIPGNIIFLWTIFLWVCVIMKVKYNNFVIIKVDIN